MGQATVSISSQGWTITASPEQGLLGISQTTLGVILNDNRIGVQAEGGTKFLPITGWSAEQGNQSLLIIHSVHPIGAWTFEIDHDTLKISCTTARVTLTAQAPAPLNRLAVPARRPARLPRRLGRHQRGHDQFRWQRNPQPIVPSAKKSRGHVLCFGVGVGISFPCTI